jgi:uncharacterized membrane protein YbhN (UPF0104 family)
VGSGEIVVEKKLWGLLVCLLAWCFLFCLCVPLLLVLWGERKERGRKYQRELMLLISFCGFVETEDVDNRRRRRRRRRRREKVWRVRRRSSSKSSEMWFQVVVLLLRVGGLGEECMSGRDGFVRKNGQ